MRARQNCTPDQLLADRPRHGTARDVLRYVRRLEEPDRPLRVDLAYSAALRQALPEIQAAA